ncbi:MAG TPA: TIGR03067 domain-containing protein [Pirellulales bacterium]|nr:TIGR03067 domain-containing protein [Pirellulales bacterium]
MTAGLCLAADAAETDKTKADVKAWQGDWRIDSIEADGRNVTSELASDVLRDVLVRVEKDKIRLVQGGDREIVAAEIALNAEADPKAADFKPQEDALGVLNGESMWGIYKLARDELKICVSIRTAVKQRPTEFKTQSDSGLYLVTLKRP